VRHVKFLRSTVAPLVIRRLAEIEERDFVGNKLPDNIVAAVEERLELLSEATIRDAESWGWTEE
jgi:hypothetical protein